MFGPMFSSSFIAYCLPVSPIVTTRINEAEPITMPSAVNAKRTLFSRKLSIASIAISRSRMVRLALASVCSKRSSGSSRGAHWRPGGWWWKLGWESPLAS